jgi:hypothetical protein
LECVDSATLSSFLFLFGNDARIAPACLPVIAGAKERQKDGDRKESPQNRLPAARDFFQLLIAWLLIFRRTAAVWGLFSAISRWLRGRAGGNDGVARREPKRFGANPRQM